MSGISNHYDSMTAIKSLIDGISMSGLTGGVVIQEVGQYDPPRTDPIVLPFISISPYKAESTGDANSNEDEVGYPILIAIVAAPDPSQLETRLGWRQSIRRRMRNKSLSGLTRNFNIQPELFDCVDIPAWKSKLFVSGLVARVFFEEPRT